MVRFHYDNAAAGIPAGAIKSLPDGLAAELVRLGVGHIVKEAENKPANEKEVKVSAPDAKTTKSARKRTATR